MTNNSNTPVENVIRTVATVEDVDPASMTPPLATVIDPDALNGLVDHGSNDPDREFELQFSYCGHEVVVTDCGTVEVD